MPGIRPDDDEVRRHRDVADELREDTLAETGRRSVAFRQRVHGAPVVVTPNAPMSSRSRETVACVAWKPSAARRSTISSCVPDEPFSQQLDEPRRLAALGRSPWCAASAEPPRSWRNTASVVCSRFSAWSNTREAGPSITSAATSSPRCAGRQCRKIASSAACAMSAVVTRYGANSSGACFGFALLPHRRPHVCVDDVGTVHSLRHVGRHGHAPAVRLRPRHDLGIRLVGLGTSECDRHPDERASLDQRVRDVVAVTDLRDLQRLQSPDVAVGQRFGDRHEIGQRLQRVMRRPTGR